MSEHNQHPYTAKAPAEREVVYVQAPYGTAEDDEIDLVELWKILWRGKWFIMGVTLLCTLIAVYVTLYVLPVTYKATAVLQPTEVESGTMSKLSGLAGNLPIDLPGGGGGKTAQITSYLNSRTLKAELIQEYDLLPRLYPNAWDPQSQSWDVKDPQKQPTLVKALQSGALDAKFSVSKDDENGLISLGWVDQDPQQTAAMLDAVIEQTRYYLENGYETDAERERKFVERQLAEAKKELTHWERQVPGEDVTMAEIQRERSAAQSVYTELRTQLELAKIAEAKEVVRFKVLDPPFVPEQKFKPKRTLICSLTIVSSGFVSVFLVFFWHFVQNVRRRED